MQTNEEILIKEFELGLEIAEPVVTKYLSTKFDGQPIAINSLPLLEQQFVCLHDCIHPDYISVLQFLKLCIKRWDQEARYQNEIISIKNQIIEHFEELCNEVKDEKLIDIIINKREVLIELLFTLCEFDQKQMAGSFCKELMNGFEIEALDKFENYAFYVLLKPFTTALPIELVEHINKVFKNDLVVLNNANMDFASSKINTYVKDHFKPILINVSEVGSDNVLEMAIEANLAKRKPISIIIEKPTMHESVINKYRTNLSFISLKMTPKIFMKNNISYAYEAIKLISANKKNINQKTFEKFPKTLKELSLDFRQYFTNAF